MKVQSSEVMSTCEVGKNFHFHSASSEEVS